MENFIIMTLHNAMINLHFECEVVLWYFCLKKDMFDLKRIQRQSWSNTWNSLCTGNKRLNQESLAWKRYVLNGVSKTISGMVNKLLSTFSSSTRINSKPEDASRSQFQSQKIWFCWQQTCGTSCLRVLWLLNLGLEGKLRKCFEMI